MIVKEYTCKVCGKRYRYECGGEAGYARDLCSPYCGGLHSGGSLRLVSAVELVELLCEGRKVTNVDEATCFCSIKKDGRELVVFIE